ncbi:hypothetical protein AHF37_04802 [Paragonimus kellicotti]|nr:hypothetical protein AHF37_04802 [Paragonimus kellicotti]
MPQASDHFGGYSLDTFDSEYVLFQAGVYDLISIFKQFSYINPADRLRGMPAYAWKGSSYHTEPPIPFLTAIW